MRYTHSDIDQLLGHLKSEFGQHGRRAADSLLTARRLLDWAKGDDTGAPRAGNAIAYCLREVMTEILKAQDDSRQSWRSISREVVDAKQSYQRVHQSGTDEQRPLTDLLRKIDDLAEFHERESDRERRLIAVLFDRTGSAPVAGSTSVKKYQRTLHGLNKVVHGSTPYGVDQAECTWSECLALLSMLFLPDVRYRELGRLAKVEQPSVEHVEEVSELVIAAPHLRFFLARIERPVWLDMLTDSGLLDPPDNGEGWPVFVATERLARQYPAAVAHWLNKMYSRLADNIRCASIIGDAALASGEAGLPLVARIVRRHSAEPDVVRLSWDAARSANPSSDTFELFVDIVFNQQSSSFTWTFGEIAERFLSGIDSSNAMPRLQLLASKIRSTPEDDYVRSWHEHKPYGSISDRYDERYDERFDVLIHALLKGTRIAFQWTDIGSLLKLMDALPGMIGLRMRLWLLGNTPEVGVGVVIDEIATGIGHRWPNGDDLALIDRVVQTADPTQYEGRWREVLGPAPDVEDVGRALAADEPRKEWIRALNWSPFLTDILSGTWEDVLEVLSARYGRRSRELLDAKRAQLGGEIVSDDSPFSVDELTSLMPEDACRKISEWIPRDGEWMVNSRALSRTLERVVINNPSQWVRNPLRIAMALRHPTYIHRYLVAIHATLSESGAPVGKLIQLIALLRTHPWTADKLGRNQFDYDTDWTNVDRTTIDIIESLAKNDIGFAEFSDQVWTILESAVWARSDSTDRTVPARQDPIDIAINLPRTQALMAALEFMAYEFRSTDRIRPEAFCLLDKTLRLVDDDGLYHRAIIAPSIGILRHVAPEWVESNRDLLFGSEAPTGLGQKTLDQALKWGRPNRWLLEEFRCGVIDAVRRRVKSALDHFLSAVLWDWNGYSLADASEFLGSQPKLLMEACDRLGYLLDSDSAKESHIERALRFWRIMTDKGQPIHGLAGFGGFARVAKMDDRRWSELTIDTLRSTGGRIDQAHVVAERAAGLKPTDTTLEIMDNLVRRSNTIASDGKRDRVYYHTKWAQQKVEQAARELLDRSSELRESDHFRRLHTALRERGTDI